jgi:tetratricopeptide (TPR) repeat protein
MVIVLGSIATVGWGAWWWIRNRQGIALANEGYAAGFRGDHDEAIRLLTAALQKPLLPKQRSYLYTTRGTARNWKSQFQGAIEDFSAALRDDPQSAAAYVGRGYSLYRSNQSDNRGGSNHREESRTAIVCRLQLRCITKGLTN